MKDFGEGVAMALIYIVFSFAVVFVAAVLR